MSLGKRWSGDHKTTTPDSSRQILVKVSQEKDGEKKADREDKEKDNRERESSV